MSAGIKTNPRWISLFIAKWLTHNDCENMKGEPAACVDRLRQALRTAFPGVSKADIDLAGKELIAALERSLLADQHMGQIRRPFS
jgi:hypothetical protein